MAAPISVCLVCRRFVRLFVRSVHSQATESNVRVRFAPSPTGFLHLGGLRTALYNYLFAKSKGGAFILRIEDTDQTRLVPGALEKLESVLQWSKMIPDEGPSQGGRLGPYIQSQRLELYQESIKTLLKNGAAYHCFCSSKRLDLLRKDLVRRGEVPRYDNRCRHLEPPEVKEKLDSRTPFVIRLKLEPITEPWNDLIKGPVIHNVADIEGDPVMIKSDGFPTYHFANVVDDHYMGITHVLRGDEWQLSTSKHILLYKAFGWVFPQFAHLPLIVNKDGTKLSKRQGDIHIEHFKDQGYLPEAVLSFITTIGGGFDCETAGLTIDELVKHFQIERVKKNHGRLDPVFLENSNLSHLKHKLLTGTHADLLVALKTLVYEKFANTSRASVVDDHYFLHVLQWAVDEGRIYKLPDLLQPKFAFLWTTPSQDQISDLQLRHPDLPVLLTSLSAQLTKQEVFGKEALGKTLKSHAKVSGKDTSTYMHVIREALSGLKEGPPVAEMVMVIGRENTICRLKYCEKLLKESSLLQQTSTEVL